MRCSLAQWQDFLQAFGELPYKFVFDAYVWEDSIPKARMPDNVAVRIMPYLADERELIARLQNGRYDAAYLPLWRESDKQLFVRTSLSSKLTTYAAAGLPVLVDGPAESAAWELVNRYGAGVLVEAKSGKGEAGGAGGGWMRLFTDGAAWRDMAEGAARMCREAFCLERNVERLKMALAATGDRIEEA
jgi:hypothetical protein